MTEQASPRPGRSSFPAESLGTLVVLTAGFAGLTAFADGIGWFVASLALLLLVWFFAVVAVLRRGGSDIT
jgi:hypothetical protein